MSDRVNNAHTGYDFEFLLRGNFLTHLLQLLQDIGTIPRTVPVGNISFDLSSAPHDKINRLYDPFNSNADYASFHNEAFQVHVNDFPENPDWLYLTVNVSLSATNPIALYLAIKKDWDFQNFCRDIINYVNDDASEFHYFNYFATISIQAEEAEFNPLRPHDNMPELYLELLQHVDMNISNIFIGLKSGSSPELLSFFQGQLDPLNPVRINELRFEAFPDVNQNAVGLYGNLILLDHDRGYLSARGDSSSRDFFLNDDESFGFATAPGFLHHVLDDILVKVVVNIRRTNENLSDDQVMELLQGEHYPLVAPPSLIGNELRLLHIVVYNTSLSTVNRNVTTADGTEQQVASLKAVLHLSAELGAVLNLADNNLVAFISPITRKISGVNVADLFFEANLRIDYLRLIRDNIIARLLPFSSRSPWGFSLILSAIAALLANSKQGGSIVRNTLSGLGINLGAIPIYNILWDPFYSTSHQVVIENRMACFENDRLFVTGNNHLYKQPVVVDRAYLREVAQEASSLRLHYHVEVISDWRQDVQFATDRESFVQEITDPEPNIFSVMERDCIQRVNEQKIVRNIPYKPYAIVTNQDYFPNNDIDLIALYSNTEYDKKTIEIKNEFRDAIAKELIDALEKIFGEIFDVTLRNTLMVKLRPLVEDLPAYIDYVDNDLKDDVTNTITQTPGIMRLRLTPSDIDRLDREQLISMPGYQAIVREGTLYIRNIANQTKDDNLLSLAREHLT